MRARGVCLSLLLATAAVSADSGWYERNRNVLVVFPDSVKKHIDSANVQDMRGRRTTADCYLRLALRLTEEAEPFSPTNWPKGWPRDTRSLEVLKYATPYAYMNRIIGDFSCDHGRNKEAIRYYRIYMERSYLPDAGYLQRLAGLMTAEGMWNETLMVYRDLLRSLQTGNFHGAAPAVVEIERRIRRIEMVLRKVRIYVMKMAFYGVPEYMREDLNTGFREEIKNLKETVIIPDADLERVLRETRMTAEDLQYDEELSRAGKLMNADYIFQPRLTRVDDNYVLVIRVYNPREKKWVDRFEYKNPDPRYLSGFARRFVYEFQDLSIPAELLLPYTTIRWNIEADDYILNLVVSEDCRTIVCGCENGSVYVLSDRGRIVRKYRMNDRVLQVGVSPDGKYVSWVCLNGQTYMAGTATGVLWKHPLGQPVRALAISRDGKFVVAAHSNRVVYLDRRGEIYWNEELPAWVTCLAIAQDAAYVMAGTESGDVICLSEEGNTLWKQSVGKRVVRIRTAPSGEVLSVEAEDGEIFLYDRKGNRMMNFAAGEEKAYVAFVPDALLTLTGKRGNYFYFLSRDRRNLWDSTVGSRVNLLEASSDGSCAVSVEGRNIFCFAIEWK